MSDVGSPYDFLFDGAVPRIDVPTDASPDDVAAALEAVLDADRDAAYLVLAAGGCLVGVTSRRHLAMFGPPQLRSVGDADRASQPGESTHYQVITFRCGVCGHVTYTAFYDERYRPTCQVAEHGPMERM